MHENKNRKYPRTAGFVPHKFQAAPWKKKLNTSSSSADRLLINIYAVSQPCLPPQSIYHRHPWNVRHPELSILTHRFRIPFPNSSQKTKMKWKRKREINYVEWATVDISLERFDDDDYDSIFAFFFPKSFLARHMSWEGYGERSERELMLPSEGKGYFYRAEVIGTAVSATEFPFLWILQF